MGLYLIYHLPPVQSRLPNHSYGGVRRKEMVAQPVLNATNEGLYADPFNLRATTTNLLAR